MHLHIQMLCGKWTRTRNFKRGGLYFIIDKILHVQIDIHSDKVTSAMRQLSKTQNKCFSAFGLNIKRRCFSLQKYQQLAVPKDSLKANSGEREWQWFGTVVCGWFMLTTECQLQQNATSSLNVCHFVSDNAGWRNRSSSSYNWAIRTFKCTSPLHARRVYCKGFLGTCK